jgi:DNA polymerase III subunit delta
MKIESCYILAGPEAGRRAAFVGDLKAAIAAADGAPPEEHRLYASEEGIAALLGILRNGSLFAARRLVEYRGAELAKGKEDLTALAAYIAAPAPDAVLLLVSDSFYLEKALEDAIGKDRKRTFFEMFESEKPRWLAGKLRELGIGADEGGIEALLELVENETGALEAACAQLAAAFPPGSRLTEEDIEASVARNRREDAFSLFDRMASGGLEEALDALDAVLDDRRGDAVQIVSALSWSFRRLAKLHGMVEGGSDFESACYKLQIRSKAVQRQSSQAMRRFSRPDCERVLVLASDIDSRARTMGSAYERVLLQALVYGIMQKKGKLDLAWRIEE